MRKSKLSPANSRMPTCTTLVLPDQNMLSCLVSKVVKAMTMKKVREDPEVVEEVVVVMKTTTKVVMTTTTTTEEETEEAEV